MSSPAHTRGRSTRAPARSRARQIPLLSGELRAFELPIDPNGNLATKTEGTDTWVYAWDAENQLVSVEKNGAEVARFAYDPIGRRVEKAASGVTTAYTYDAIDTLRERRGTAQVSYVHGPELDEPLAMEGSDGLTYFHADALGSILKKTNAAGGLVASRQYDAWGNFQAEADEPGYAFTGREWDPEAHLYYYRARYYDPTAGRFTAQDPVGFDGGVNPYNYVGGNVTKLVDPFGNRGRQRRYRNPDGAATAGLRLCYANTRLTGWEWCGSICKDSAGWYVFTMPKTDEDSGICHPEACPSGSSPAGQFHTHPPPPGGDEDFSFKDKWNVILDPSGNSSYLGSPTGKIKRYDKECRCTRQLPGNLGK